MLDPRRVESMALMLKASRMLYYLNLARQDWTSASTPQPSHELQRGDQWLRPSRCRKLTDSEMILPRSLEEFPGFELGLHERPCYGDSNARQDFVSARVQRVAAAALSQATQQTTKHAFGALTDSYPVASIKASVVFLANPTTSIFVPGGTPLLGTCAALSPALPPLYFGRGTDAAIPISAPLFSSVLTTSQSHALAAVAAAVGPAAPSTSGCDKSFAIPLFRDASATSASRATTFFGVPPQLPTLGFLPPLVCPRDPNPLDRQTRA